MNKLKANKNRKNTIHNHYRRILRQPNLSDQEIERMRRHVGLLARTICEHLWNKKFY